METIYQKSLREYNKTKNCQYYTKGFCGFCLNCNDLKNKHPKVKKKKEWILL